MKVRWREHEIAFLTILVLVKIILLLVQWLDPSYAQPSDNYAAPFAESGLSFFYPINVLLPQIATWLLFLAMYLLINWWVVPAIKRITRQEMEELMVRKMISPLAGVVVAASLMAIGANTISYFARPHLFSYRGYPLLAIFGYNDTPLANLFFGWSRAAGLVLFFTVLACLRELIIWFFKKPGGRQAFRVMIINNFTPLFYLLLLIPFLTDPVHSRFMDYLAWTIPVVFLYMYQTFWFFPFTENTTWRDRSVLIHFFLSTFLAALFSAVVFSGQHKILELFMYWVLMMVAVSPITWLLYKQRRDKILQLRGLETALAQSTAHLQFLRSQINPHFLFNALNTLYGTALKERSEKTAEGIQMLGDMMRFMLEENHLDRIPMEKELEYLRNYIALQKLRTQLSDNIQITDNIEEVRCDASIAPMLLIPFVENAFKHGISLQERSWIDIHLECHGSSLRFTVKNSIHTRSAEDTEKNRSGIGLSNLAARLSLLYAGRHEMTTHEHNKEFIACLHIQ